MTFILPSFGASAISAVPGGGGGGASFSNGYALSFDGVDDYATTANSVLNFYNTGGSISAWIKPSSVTATQVDAFKNRSIISKGAVYLGLNINEAGYPTLYFYDGTIREVVATTQVSTSSWMHICATWSTTGSAIYVNGTSEATSSNTPADIDSGQTGSDVYIGKTVNNQCDHFGGLIDELAVFNTELSSSDITAIYNSGVPDDLTSYSPTNWWRMGDNDSGTGTTITDQGSGGNDGTLVNGPTFLQGVPSVPAAYSNTYSVDFDGTDDFVDCGDISVLSNASSLTISGWFNFNSLNTLCLTSGSSLSNRIYFYVPSTGKVEIYFDGAKYMTSSINLSTSQWYHLAIVKDGNGSNNLKLFINGSLSDGNTGTFASATGSNAGDDFWIGSAAAYTSLPLDGLADEVAVWGSALSDSDVTAIYNSGTPADLTSYSPVSWWRMGDNDGGTGTTITDQGSGGNDGTLTNGPTFSTTVPS